MIYKALNLLSKELNAYMNSIDSQDDDLVELGNIALFDSSQAGTSTTSLSNKLVITLINAEQEKTLKNIPNYTKTNGKTEYSNPPVYLNLYILVAATSTIYVNALTYISRIVKFFQSKNVFTVKNSVVNNSLESSLQLSDFKIIVDLYSPTFEEINFLWSTLGGKQLPSVIYKLRLVELQSDDIIESRGLIKEIASNDKHGS